MNVIISIDVLLSVWVTASDPCLNSKKAKSVLFVVIGKGGEQISRIQLESGCKIQIASGKLFKTKHFFYSRVCHLQVSNEPKT